MWQKTWKLCCCYQPMYILHCTLSLQLSPEAEERREDGKKAPLKWGMFFILRSKADIYALLTFFFKGTVIPRPWTSYPVKTHTLSEKPVRKDLCWNVWEQTASWNEKWLKCWIINDEGSLSSWWVSDCCQSVESACWLYTGNWKPTPHKSEAFKIGHSAGAAL